MKRIILSIAVVMFAAILVASAAFAHGQEQHVMGQVAALTESSITVQTKAKDTVTVYTMPETKYKKSTAAASMKDLKVGDRVVIHAKKMGDKLMATDVRFAIAAKTRSRR